jgi:hypothetical protein
VKQEVARVRQQLQEAELEEMAFGQSQDGQAWVVLVRPRPSPARAPDGEKIAADALTTFLDEAVWRAWRLACGIPPLEPSPGMSATCNSPV